VRKQRVTGGDPYRAQIERTAALLDRDPGEVSDLVEDWMQRRPSRWLGLLRRRGLVEEIRAHRARGGRTAIVSDYPARRKLSALGVADLFDVVVASGEPDGPEQLKPDPAGYLLAAERLAVEPARCLVIGDRDDADGAAARAAGMAFRKV
jgi:HAD superfamily hydrolase (TIGR01549 family)